MTENSLLSPYPTPMTKTPQAAAGDPPGRACRRPQRSSPWPPGAGRPPFSAPRHPWRGHGAGRGRRAAWQRGAGGGEGACGVGGGAARAALGYGGPAAGGGPRGSGGGEGRRCGEQWWSAVMRMGGRGAGGACNSRSTARPPGAGRPPFPAPRRPWRGHGADCRARRARRRLLGAVRHLLSPRGAAEQRV